MRRCCDPDLMTVEEAKAEERQNIDEEEDIELELELEKDFLKKYIVTVVKEEDYGGVVDDNPGEKGFLCKIRQ